MRVARLHSLLYLVPMLVGAQQTSIPVRSLGPVIATTPVTFTAVSQLVALPDGRVMVADAGKRLVTMFDSSLKNPSVILDSAAGKPNSYASGAGGAGVIGGGGVGGPLATVAALGAAAGAAAGAAGRGGRGGGAPPASNFLFPFRGDSSFWYDRTANGMIVLDPSGKLGRVMAAPTVQFGTAFAPAFGAPMSSATLGLVYKARMPLPDFPERPANAPDSVARALDSALVVRMDYASHASETVTKIGLGTGTVRTMRGNGMFMSPTPNLYPFVDNAVVTTDGSIAIFHAREYRIDWVTPEGTLVAGTRLPYAWRKVTDEIRQHLLDSINGGRRRGYDSVMAARAADSTRIGSVSMTTRIDVSADGEIIRKQVPMPPPPMPSLVGADDIPDFFPPTVNAGDVMADADNHVWIRPILAPAEPGFAVWDVVSRAGGIVERVRVPDSRTIAGFGPGGVVYLVFRDAGASTLERARIR